MEMQDDAILFPVRVYKMIEKETMSTSSIKGVVWADPEGRSFQITNTSRFIEILPLYFKHNKLNSFQRQLNLYGFRRSQINESYCYTHPLFIRGRKDLLAEIKRLPCNRAGKGRKGGGEGFEEDEDGEVFGRDLVNDRATKRGRFDDDYYAARLGGRVGGGEGVGARVDMTPLEQLQQYFSIQQLRQQQQQQHHNLHTQQQPIQLQQQQPQLLSLPPPPLIPVEVDFYSRLQQQMIHNQQMMQHYHQQQILLLETAAASGIHLSVDASSSSSSSAAAAAAASDRRKHLAPPPEPSSTSTLFASSSSTFSSSACVSASLLLPLSSISAGGAAGATNVLEERQQTPEEKELYEIDLLIQSTSFGSLDELDVSPQRLSQVVESFDI